MTTPPSEELVHEIDTPSSPPIKENSKAPLDPEKISDVPPSNKSQNNPFTRFWSGQTADTSDKNKKRHRWLDRKPDRRHSVELEALDEQDHRLFRYALRRERSLLPRPKFYSKRYFN